MGIPFTDLPECDSIQAWKTPRILSPGVDYPQTFQELDNWFRNDAACREYIRRLRWPNGCRTCPPYHTIIDPTAVSQGLGQ